MTSIVIEHCHWLEIKLTVAFFVIVIALFFGSLAANLGIILLIYIICLLKIAEAVIIIFIFSLSFLVILF